MTYTIDEYAIAEIRTFLANIDEPELEEEWDAFDEKDFRETAMPAYFTDKSPLIDHNTCAKTLEYLDKVLSANATIGEAYELLGNLEEECRKAKDGKIRKKIA